MGKFIDRTGQKINRLTFIKYVGNRKWLVRCDCGTEKIVLSGGIVTGQIKSCGCLNAEKIREPKGHEDLTGQKFNYLTAVKFVGYDEKSHNCKWLFKCDCGNEKILNASGVKSGKTKSCGCYNSKLSAERWTIHGKNHTKEHRTWCGMRRRCKDVENYPNYAGRGIKVCDRWLESFENFLDDMGLAPTPKHTIDRINNNGNYEPSNCRWATQKQQNRNYSRNIDITINNETHCLKEWCEIYGKKYDIVYQRIRTLNWEPIKALFG